MEDLIKAKGDALAEYLCEAPEAVCMRFVDTVEAFGDESKTTWFHPDFTHQHFGETERLFGYSDLRVQLSFTCASLHMHYELKYRDTVTEQDSTMKPDDIFKDIDELFADTQKVYRSKDEFVKVLQADAEFKPFGEVIHSYTTDCSAEGVSYKLYKQQCPGSEPFRQYLGRMQSFAFWFIDAAVYTDTDDTKWTHYMLYETKRESGSERYAFVGYASIYNYYAYPEHIRPRIAQILVLPPYRRQGHGVQLLQAIYNDLICDKNVVDITAEDPSDNFEQLRDFVDTANCSRLACFQPEALRAATGFALDMAEQARHTLKLPRKQARRIYEILRLRAVNEQNAAEFKDYRIYVKQRLNAPFEKSKRDLNKLTKVLRDEEKEQLAAEQSDEQRKQQLHDMFQQTIANYRRVLERVSTYASRMPEVRMAKPITNGHTTVTNGYH